MNHSRRQMKLYNVLFPFWMLIWFPQLWLIVLPGNFLIDSAVLLIGLMALKIEDKKQWYRKYVFKIFGFGMLSDIIGSVYMFLMLAVFEVASMGDELSLTIPAILISAILIFVFNYYITFRKVDKKERLTLAIVFAIVTAPYTFLVPTRWLY